MGFLSEIEEPPGMRHWLRFTFLLRPGGRARSRRLKQFRLHHFRLLLFLFAVDAVLERSLLIFDRDLTAAFLTYFDVRAAHRIGRTPGF